MAIKLFIAAALYGAVLGTSQVIFEDEVAPARQQFENNVLVITLERPNQSTANRRPPPTQRPQFQGQNGFGFGNQNGGFRPPPSSFGSSSSSSSFGSSSSSSSSSFGFPQQQQQQQQRPNQGNQGFSQPQPNNPNNNFQQQQQQSGFQNQNEVVVAPRLSDCRTYFDTEGFCTPLNACGRIARDIQNRSPTMIARILGRSICGFSGVIPKVCCPSSRAQHHHHHHQRPQQQQFTNEQLPNKHNNNNFGNNGGGGVVGDNQDFIKNNEATKNPGFGSGNNNNNGGGGLIIIPPSEPSTTTTTTTTTTPFPIPMDKDPVKKPPAGNSGVGLIIGDGPIALLPAHQGGGGESIAYSDEGLPQDCGFSNASHTRIVGGKTSEKGAWPWIAALGYKDKAGNVNYLCGGALISPNYVVTASHCLHDRDDLTADGVKPLEMEVEKMILHPQYDPATFKNDIALVRLKKPVPFSRQIHPVCLPSTPQLRNQRFENTSPFVAGWGAIQFNGPSSSVLREVQVPTVPDSVCQEKYASFKSAVVDDTNLCAGLQNGGKDACQGDSGGPLQQPVGTNRYVLIGVVSFGFKCAEPGFPGVYTRVTSHLNWLQNTIKQ